MIFNQFEQMGNHLWHYEVTGNAMIEAFNLIKKPGDKFAGACFTTGSAGTIGAGDKLKEEFPTLKLGAGEAIECPTLLENGFGEHDIEGIGDKHVPWIHDVKKTDIIIGIHDQDSKELIRLFNDPEGRDFLAKDLGVNREWLDQLALLGISGVANLLCCIKMAKYYEFTENDIIGTVLTDSVAMYQSRIAELEQRDGAYSHEKAACDYIKHIACIKTDNMLELTYPERKRVHNLKYYTWVEQQGKTSEDLNAQWYGTYFEDVQKQAEDIDKLIIAFNEAVAGK